jgi:phosphopentomutase
MRKKLKKNVDLGIRKTLLDTAQIIADIFGLPAYERLEKL